MMKYGLDISPAGDWGRPDQIAELAALSEDHGWDGVFCEDYLAFPGGRPTYDVWITLGLVAHATTRLTLGTMVTPLPRRHPETVALQAMSVYHVSGGRLVLGVGTGDSQGDLAGMTRGGPGQRSGAILDEALDLVCRLWSGDRVSHSGEGYLVDGARLVPPPVQRPRIPIWVGGAITKSAARPGSALGRRVPLPRAATRLGGPHTRRRREAAGRRPAARRTPSQSVAVNAGRTWSPSDAMLPRSLRPAPTGGTSTCRPG